MPLVHILLTVPAPDGSLTPAEGALRFRPTARRTIPGTPDAVVLPSPFKVDLVAGASDVTLAPTSSLWVWQIDEHLSRTPARRIYAQVPDVASMDYTDLVAVDPTTLDPAAAPDPSWAAAMNLQLARTPEAIISGAITRDSGGAPLSAPVTWPDGVTGTFAGTPSPTFAGALDAYTITHGTKTYAQPAVTRNASGAITDQPAITIT